MLNKHQQMPPIHVHLNLRLKASKLINILQSYNILPHLPTPFQRPSGRGRHGIQLGDQLRDHAVHDAPTIAAAATGGRQGVQLIEEQDAGRQVPSILEERPAETPWVLGLVLGAALEWLGGKCKLPVSIVFGLLLGST